MKHCLLMIALAAAIALPGAEEVVYRWDFNSPDSLKGWNRARNMTYLSTGGRDGGGCVLFQNTAEGESELSGIVLDVEKFKGRGVLLEGWMKAEGVTKPSAPYLGPKLMLPLVSRGNQRRYPDQAKKIGTYDWEKFTVFARVPESGNRVELSIGLQSSVGKLWIDDIKISLLPIPSVPVEGLKDQLPMQKETKFRGVMSGHDLSEDAFRELGEVWNANLMRFQIPKGNGDNTTPAGFRKIVEDRLKVLDRTIPLARKYGVRLLIEMHVGPGTRLTDVLSNQLSWEPEMQQLLADIWVEIATKYKDEPVVWGYDLLNEPREENYVYTPAGGLDWNRLAEKVALAIRKVDPKTPIIVESAEWGNPSGFENLRPINVPNVIYSFHFYNPHEYTHQGIQKRPSGFTYPGVAGKKMWDKAALEEEMRPVIEFQRKYQVPILMGEFSAVRWAPNAEQYVEDLISIYEKYGWDWIYHAFREYEGWDAELGADRADASRVKDTPRRAVLLKYMKKNQR